MKRLLFETAFGDWFLAQLEKWLGLAIVPLEQIEPLHVDRQGAEWKQFYQQVDFETKEHVA